MQVSKLLTWVLRAGPAADVLARLRLRPIAARIATDAFGNALGNSIADSIGNGAQQAPVLDASATEGNQLGNGLQLKRTGVGLGLSARDFQAFDARVNDGIGKQVMAETIAEMIGEASSRRAESPFEPLAAGNGAVQAVPRDPS